MTVPLTKWRRLGGLLTFALVLMISCSKKGAETDPQIGRETLAELRIAIREQIPDLERQGRMLAIADKFSAKFEQFNDIARDFDRRVLDLNADYDAPREAFDELATGARIARREILTAMLRLRFEMISIVSPEEWEAISEKRKKTLLD